MSNKKVLISNFLSLSGIQIASYILPLITVPYLVRVLGPDKFGLIAFAQAFIQYFILITDYGFNLSATREISINRNNKERVSEIFNSVMIIKTIFMSISFLILCILIFNIGKFKAEWLIYVYTFGIVLGNVLFPVWFFQGIEKMRDMAILSVLSQAIFTACIFIFIRDQDDYIYVPLINSVGLIISGIFSLTLVFKKFEVRFFIPPVKKIRHEIKEGWHIFASTIAISLYTISNTFILGLFTHNTIVGYYSAGEKIVKAIQGLIGPLSQTIYPHISKLASESKEMALNFVRKAVYIVGTSTFLISLLLFIFAPQIIHIILGEQFKESIIVVQILSFLPFIVGLSNIFGVQTMLNLGLKRVFTKILLIASFISIILSLLLVIPLQHIGISIAILTTEIFVTASMFFVLKKMRLLKFY